MFDRLDECEPAGLLAAMAVALRGERIAVARRLIAAGLFVEDRIAKATVESATWVVDDWDAAAAEIGAVVGIGRRRASADMTYGQMLVTRFPLLAEQCWLVRWTCG